MTEDPAALIRRYLADLDCGWAIGTYGAIAEFVRDPGEPELLSQPEQLSLATARGALRLEPPLEAAVIAYETLTSRRNGWTHGLAFCLPAEQARSHRRAHLTEIGPDNEPVLEADRGAILFDIGAGAPHIDAWIRTRDSALIAGLRQECGRAILTAGDRAMELIKRASPHRVFRSALGRLEVFQAIGAAGPAVVPDGPHTHVLPDLLALGVTHAEDVPIPTGQQPCLWLFPPHPTTDPRGHPKPFDGEQHVRFQRLLAAYGDAEYSREKGRVLAAVQRGQPPHDYAPPSTALGLTALRVALRQLAHEKPASQIVADWRDAFDKTSADEPDH